MVAMLFLSSQDWIPVLPMDYGYNEDILPHGGDSLGMIRQ